MDWIFRLIDEMDSFKKIVLFFLTGITALVIYFGYQIGQDFRDHTRWISEPHIVKTVLPCQLLQVRKHYYLLGIDFPLPDDIDDRVESFLSAFLLVDIPSHDEFENYCSSLIEIINSRLEESLLEPYQDRNLPR